MTAWQLDHLPKTESEREQRQQERQEMVRSIFKLMAIVVVGVILLKIVDSIGNATHEAKVEKAGEFIDKCENPYAFSQGVNGKDCDDARKLVNNYTEKEWAKEKVQLIELGEVTEEDYLYDQIKEKLDKKYGTD